MTHAELTYLWLRMLTEDDASFVFAFGCAWSPFCQHIETNRSNEP